MQMTKAHEDEEQQLKMGREKATDYSLLAVLQTVADLCAGREQQEAVKSQTAMAKMRQLCLQMSHLTIYRWTKALEAMSLFT